MNILIILFCLLIILGSIEKYIHTKCVNSIPVRIHVNGSRGKSTTTRFIAGALREAGFKVIAKTTGTAPRLINEDGSEEEIIRRGIPRIIEQLKIIIKAAKRNPDIIVLECMAISPEIQWISEHRMIKSTIGVITNVRRDHLDKMGSTLPEIADTLSLTIPHKGNLITGDNKFYNKFKNVAADKLTDTTLAISSGITNNDIEGFKYPVFKENIACAVEVCKLLKIEKSIALAGMKKTRPDPGTLKFYRLKFKNNDIYLINSFAANDITSTLKTLVMWKNWYNYEQFEDLPLVGIFNNRFDRGYRIKEFVKMENEIDFSEIIILGHKLLPALKTFTKSQLSLSTIGTKFKCTKLINKINEKYKRDILLFGFGNTKGNGEKVIDYFADNGEEIIC